MRFVRLVPTYHYRQTFPCGYKLAHDHCHECTEIMYMEAGRCAFLVGEGEVVLGSGELIFLGSFFPHGMDVRERACRIINLEFVTAEADAPLSLASHLPELEPFVGTRGGFLVLRDEDLTVMPVLKDIVEELDLNRWAGEELVQLRLWELLIVLARLHRRKLEEAAGSRYVRRAKEYMARYYARPLSMGEVAGAVGVSRSYLQRLFHREAGLTPHDYLTRIRIERAKALLARTDLPLVEVAASVGLGSQQYFQRLFRRQVGVTPGEFRRGRIGHDTKEERSPSGMAQMDNTVEAAPAMIDVYETSEQHSCNDVR
ncbi:MAG: AraC family transcriptional regulator [Bacillota bacterium]